MLFETQSVSGLNLEFINLASEPQGFCLCLCLFGTETSHPAFGGRFWGSDTRFLSLYDKHFTEQAIGLVPFQGVKQSLTPARPHALICTEFIKLQGPLSKLPCILKQAKYFEVATLAVPQSYRTAKFTRIETASQSIQS